VLLGTGAERFVAIQDHEIVPIIHGIQGGHHVWGAARAAALNKAGLRLGFVLSLVGSETVVTRRDAVVDLTGGDEEPGEVAGVAVFLDDPGQIHGQACRLTLTAVDTRGRTAAAERLITPDFTSPE
jgi:hypothetical protein